MTIIRTGASRCLGSSVAQPVGRAAHRCNTDQLLMLSRTMTPTAEHDHCGSPHPSLPPLGISQIHLQGCGHRPAPPGKFSGHGRIGLDSALLPGVEIRPRPVQSLIALNRSDPNRRIDLLELPQQARPWP